MKNIFSLLLFLLPITTLADCADLVSHLNDKHPNRILTQTYGYSLDRLVIYEKSDRSNGALLSVVECVNNKYQTVKTFEISETLIADLQFDEIEGTMIVVFSINPPKTGYIDKAHGVYTFNPGLYER